MAATNPAPETPRAPAGTLKTVPVGRLSTNCYLLADGCGGWVVVDPGDEAPAILAALEGAPVSLVLVTHRHFDHVGAVDAIAARSQNGWGMGVADGSDFAMLLQSDCAAFDVDVTVATPPTSLFAEGDVIEAGELRLRVVACPGHTPGGVTYVDDAHGLAFTGDTLFAGSAGRTDFPGGSPRDLFSSLAKLAQLPPQTRVLPGHGPATTVGAEAASNPYVRRAVRLA